MRRTATLDPDVDRMLRDSMRGRGVSFKQALNDAIRAGLSVGKQAHHRRFTQRSFSLGAPQNFQCDKALIIADALENEDLRRKRVR